MTDPANAQPRWWQQPEAIASALARWGVRYTPYDGGDHRHRKASDEDVREAMRRVELGLSTYVAEARRLGIRRETFRVRRRRIEAQA